MFVGVFLVGRVPDEWRWKILEVLEALEFAEGRRGEQRGGRVRGGGRGGEEGGREDK